MRKQGRACDCGTGRGNARVRSSGSCVWMCAHKAGRQAPTQPCSLALLSAPREPSRRVRSLASVLPPVRDTLRSTEQLPRSSPRHPSPPPSALTRVNIHNLAAPPLRLVVSHSPQDSRKSARTELVRGGRGMRVMQDSRLCRTRCLHLLSPAPLDGSYILAMLGQLKAQRCGGSAGSTPALHNAYWNCSV